MRNEPGYHATEEFKTAESALSYTFIKEDGSWFIYLPQYLEQGWSRKDLELVEGAHKLLNAIANGQKKITILMNTEPFEGADVLELVELCEAPRGGGVYLMETCNGRPVQAILWICDIALFVFGDIPPYIYVKRVRSRQ